MSLNEEQIKALIEAGLSGSQVTISGDGRHFEAVIVSDEFQGKTMIQQHRLVNSILAEHFKTDAVHALSFKTYTPEEWAQASA